MRDWPLGMIVPLQDRTPFSPHAPADWGRSLTQVRAAGYDGVELAITDPAVVDPDTIMEALTPGGLRLLSITTGQAAGLEGLSLTSPDVQIQRRTIDRIKAHMDFARDFGAVVIVGSLRGTVRDVALLIESLRECATHAPQVRLALEPLNRYESQLLNTVNDALAAVENVGAENLGLLVDTFHANIEETDISEAFRSAGDRLFHVHLADSNRLLPGEGHIDFGPIWNTLDKIDYRGAMVLEAVAGKRGEEFAEAPANLKRLM
jgi:5-keto-L-gluconate epimerase